MRTYSALRAFAPLVFIFMHFHLLAQIPTEDLVGYWPFSGNAIEDLQGQNNGEIFGCQLTEDRCGNSNSAYSFDGIDDYLICGQDDMGIIDEVSVSCWIKKTNPLDDLDIVVAKYELLDDSGYSLQFELNGAPEFRGRDGNDSFTETQNDGISIADGEWHHLVGIVDHSIWSIYVDTELIGQVDNGHSSVNVGATDANLVFGRRSSSAVGLPFRFFEGVIDDIAIYKRAITLEEIIQLYNTQCCPLNSVCEEICNNGIDDDGDGLIDCDDPDCYLSNSNECVTCLGDSLSFADVVLEYMPECAAELHPNTNMPDKATGAPDYQLPLPGEAFGMNFASLGEGGFIRLGFTDNVLVNSGNADPDLWVFEVGIDIEASDIELRPLDSNTENLLLAAGLSDNDNDGFYYINSIGGATSNLDIDAIIPGFNFGDLRFDAVKITDVFQNNPCLGSAGADIDAVCALSSMPAEDCSNGIDDDGDGLVDCDDPDLFNDCCCLTPVPLDLGPDLNPCLGSSIVLNAGDHYANYLWSDQSMASTLSVTTDGIYSVIVVDSCDVVQMDTIVVEFVPNTGGNESLSFCEGDSLIYNNEVYYEAGVYQQTLTSSDGCDSIVTLDISTNPNYSEFFMHTIDFGQTLSINGINYTESGNYTQNLTTQAGCDSIINVDLIVNHVIVHYDFNDCLAWSTTDNFVYSEFTADYPEPLNCDITSASFVHRENPMTNRHSCTPGVGNSLAMCVSSLDDCQYDKNSDLKVIFEVTIEPNPGYATQISSFNFFQKAPLQFDWINGDSGPNNYPTLFGIRVLRNGQEILFMDDIPTDNVWREMEYEFFSNPDFYSTDSTTYQFELMGYCLTGNGSPVTAWDLDEISITANCEQLGITPRYVSGTIFNENNQPMEGISTTLYGQSTLIEVTGQNGKFAFYNNINAAYLDAHENEYPLDGVSTLDLLLIQKHILGLSELSSPYQLLAADVNQSGSVSAIDLIQIRKLILGVYHEFPQCDSWRFLTTDQNIQTDPFGCKDRYELNAVANAQAIDFIGIKMGDVDGSNSANIHSASTENRSANRITLTLEKELNHPNMIGIYAEHDLLINGLQLSLDLKQSELLAIIPGTVDLQDFNYTVDPNNQLYISWIAPQGVMLDQDALFYVQTNAYLDKEITLDLGQNGFRNEIYVGPDNEVRTIELRSTEKELVDDNLLDIIVQPNPMNYEAKILLGTRFNGQISVYDVQGNLVVTDQLTDATVYTLSKTDLTQKGIYYVRVESERGMQIKKLIVI